MNRDSSIALDLFRLDFGIQGDKTLNDKISLDQLGRIFYDFTIRE